MVMTKANLWLLKIKRIWVNVGSMECMRRDTSAGAVAADQGKKAGERCVPRCDNVETLTTFQVVNVRG